MSLHDDRVSLRQMLDHAREVVDLSSGKTRADLDRERLLLLGLVKLVEIVGEAANRVSSKFQSEHPAIPWPQIISMRNRLVHGYDRIDYDRLWKVVKDEVPPLVETLNKIVGSAAD